MTTEGEPGYLPPEIVAKALYEEIDSQMEYLSNGSPNEIERAALTDSLLNLQLRGYKLLCSQGYETEITKILRGVNGYFTDLLIRSMATRVIDRLPEERTSDADFVKGIMEDLLEGQRARPHAVPDFDEVCGNLPDPYYGLAGSVVAFNIEVEKLRFTVSRDAANRLINPSDDQVIQEQAHPTNLLEKPPQKSLMIFQIAGAFVRKLRGK